MRRAFFWLGWIVLIVLPLAYGVQIYLAQDFPAVEVWKWLVPFAAVVLIYFSRNTDDVLHHRLV